MRDVQTVTINFYGLPLVCRGTYYRGTPEVHYLRNGNPGYPAEPAEFDFESITIAGHDFMDFLDTVDSLDRPLFAQIEDMVVEAIEEESADYSEEE